jgi:hypothetical protein
VPHIAGDLANEALIALRHELQMEGTIDPVRQLALAIIDLSTGRVGCSGAVVSAVAVALLQAVETHDQWLTGVQRLAARNRPHGGDA